MDEYEPITGELRGAGRESNVYHVMSDTVDRTVTFDGDRFDGLCDDIDSVHAHLERENESLRKKVKDQSAQLSEVQGALERRNSELKPRWQKEINRLKAERDSMAAALDAAQGEHAFAPESHYMMLPKDADGVPIHVGDVMEWIDPNGEYSLVCTVEAVSLDGFITWSADCGRFMQKDTKAYRHHVPDTWERIIEDAVNVHGNGFNPCWTDERDALVARCKELAGEK